MNNSIVNTIPQYVNTFSNWINTILFPIPPKCIKCGDEKINTHSLEVNERHQCEMILHIYNHSKICMMDMKIDKLYYYEHMFMVDQRCHPMSERDYNDLKVTGVDRAHGDYYCIRCYLSCRSSIMKSRDESKKMI